MAIVCVCVCVCCSTGTLTSKLTLARETLPESPIPETNATSVEIKYLLNTTFFNTFHSKFSSNLMETRAYNVKCRRIVKALM